MRRSVKNSINHSPMVIGKVRAWLKYVLQRLSDQEGNSFSRSLSVRSSRSRSSELVGVVAAPGRGYSDLEENAHRCAADEMDRPGHLQPVEEGLQVVDVVVEACSRSRGGWMRPWPRRSYMTTSMPDAANAGATVK